MVIPPHRTGDAATPRDPCRPPFRSGVGPYPIVRSRRGLAMVIVSTSAWLTPAARSRGRKERARYV